MADDPNRPPQGDNFGWGQQPLHRTDETTGDEGIEPPVQGHDEAAFGRDAEAPDHDEETDQDDHGPGNGAEQQVPGYPNRPRGSDAQE